MATMDFLAEVKRGGPWHHPGETAPPAATGWSRASWRQRAWPPSPTAHECPEIPIIAANLHRAILPRQSQIWGRHPQDGLLLSASPTPWRAARSWGRMCLSGDVTELSDGAVGAVIDAAIAFYRRIARPSSATARPTTRARRSPGCATPEGWQGIVRLGKKRGGLRPAAHLWPGEVPEEIRMPLPAGTPETIQAVYSDTQEAPWRSATARAGLAAHGKLEGGRRAPDGRGNPDPNPGGPRPPGEP